MSDSATSVPALRGRLDECMPAERRRLAKRLSGVRGDQVPPALVSAIQTSVSKRQRRLALPVRLTWPDLPVVEALPRLREVIEQHQVVVVAGETGSGKTTQLPKLCLELGRGRERMIGHTQPRRLAARSVAARLAEETDSRLGEQIGYRVRFTDQVGDDTLVKLLTDGMLLAEVQHDRLLENYDTLIIDEAHERSLNIDFLLGFLRQLLPKRPDLKVIITSATIDHERFAAHFQDAPVVEVSGRTWPVEVRYRDRADSELDLGEEVSRVLREIEDEERGRQPGARDVLVFLSGEREIRELHHHLRRCDLRDTEILPLYARLGPGEQQKVFSPHRGRRIVLSTNVAETSLTVPGIRYVIDTGTARISRYSVHSKVQRLPVEPISQASADQRAGRSGRVMPGICYRLYSEADFIGRPAFTDPEIQRTNLASVILQMTELGLGEIEHFPFIDPPEGRLVRDGYRLLEELGAIRGRKLTGLGRKLARFPVDPRLGRMLLEAAEREALAEVLIIVAALAAQDPRERPHDKQQQADQAHQRFVDKDSDFAFFISLWHWAEQQRDELSRNQYEKALRKQFLSPLRMREWRDTHRQLLLQCRELKLPVNRQSAGYEAIHRSLLSGLLGQIMTRTDEGEWLSTRNRKPVIWPGSALSKSKFRWLMAAELVESSRLFARTVARIEPEWVEQAAPHLLKRQYSEPHWSKKRGATMAREQVSLFGLPLVSGRKVHYGPIDPALARELLIREGLVAGQLNETPTFVTHNRQLIEQLGSIEDKLRRRDILADEQVQVDFYSEHLPDGLYTLRHLLDWYQRRADNQQRQALLMTEALLLPEGQPDAATDYPDSLRLGPLDLPLEYSFAPDGGADGVSLKVPVTVLNQLRPERLQWLVPGLLRDKLEALIRALPKARRRHFVPVPDYVHALMEALRPGEESLLPALTRELQRMTGVRIEQEEWREEALPGYLRINIRVLDGDRLLEEGRDLDVLQKRFADRAVAELAPKGPVREATTWVFADLPGVREEDRGGVSVRVYPALVDQGDRVAELLLEDQEEAVWQHARGVARLILLRLADQTRTLSRYANDLPGFRKLAADRSFQPRKLIDQCLLALAMEHFDLHEADVRDEQAFHERVRQHGGDWDAACRSGLETLAGTFGQYRELMQRLEKGFPLAWAHAHRDIKAQLGELFPADFMLAIPLENLRDYSRYLKAIALRLDKLGGQIGEDRARVAELEAFRDQYQRRAADRPLWRQPAPLRDWRWMLEEYRVSLFAQQLGTRRPVSAKRLRKWWEDC